MKSFILAVLSLMLPAFCLAANNIKMVTYFPVPYASYSNLGVAGTCDVGLLNTCSLDSGPSLKVSKKGSLLHALNSGAITVNSGTLSLDSSATEGKVSGSGLTAGTSMGASGSGSLEFKHNLTVKSMPSTIQSAEATNEAIMNSLTLFGQTFPGCDAANNKISWRNLTLNGENGVYLVCGEGAGGSVTDCASNPDSEQCCRDTSFFIQNQALCCGNMTDSLFNYLYDEGYPNCCAYTAVFNNHRTACCQDGTAPGNDVDGYCYNTRYYWQSVSKTLNYTYCDNFTEPCWQKSPFSQYTRCSAAQCNADTVGQYCLEDNDEEDTCGLNHMISETLRADGTRCMELQGTPLMSCFEEKTPVF